MLDSVKENLTNCRKYCDGPIVIAVRFVTRFKECCYFALFQMAGKMLEPRERLNSLVNTGVIHSAESLRSLELILSNPITLFVFKVFRS